MDNEVFDIEELLKTHLSDGQQHSKEDLFPKIEEKLLKRKRKRRFLWIFFWLVLGAGLVTAGTFILKPGDACECEEHSTANLKKNELASERKDNPTIPRHVKKDERVQSTDHLSMRLADRKSNGENDRSEVTELNHEQVKAERVNPRSSGGDNTKTARRSSVNDTSIVLALAEESNEIVTRIGDSSEQLEMLVVGNENHSISSETVSEIEDEKEDSTTVDLPSLMVEEQDSLLLVDSINPEPQTRFAFFVHGGPTMYDMAVFKPYFTSGVLSNRSFRSSGWGVTLGASKPLGDHFDLQLAFNYNHKNTRFSYDLLVGEEEYMNLQIENQPIALEQLDQENSCNCFLAKDASLEYGVSTVSLMTGIDYHPFLWEKVRLSSSLQFGTNVLTNFRSHRQQVVEFPSNSREFFSTFSMRFGLTLGYNIRKNVSLNLYPGYSISLAGRSNLYAKNLRELAFPIGLRMEF